MAKLLYCPVCGKILSSINKYCPNCKATMPPKESLFDSSYYKNKSEQVYGLSAQAFKILIQEEASKSVYFDKSKCVYNVDMEEKYIEYRKNPVKKTINKNVPQCPTCGSTNIKKISTTSKVIGAAMWGLFSKTAHSQFQCNNCGYKW